MARLGSHSVHMLVPSGPLDECDSVRINAFKETIDKIIGTAILLIVSKNFCGLLQTLVKTHMCAYLSSL